jgi:hypothetical protein
MPREDKQAMYAENRECVWGSFVAYEHWCHRSGLSADNRIAVTHCSHFVTQNYLYSWDNSVAFLYIHFSYFCSLSRLQAKQAQHYYGIMDSLQ